MKWDDRRAKKEAFAKKPEFKGKLNKKVQGVF
jgi:hypothetical protein